LWSIGAKGGEIIVHKDRTQRGRSKGGELIKEGDQLKKHKGGELIKEGDQLKF
jgi:hypothetical protein